VGRTDAVGDYLQLFTAFVLPSRSESMPNTLLEALRAHLPAICSEVGGVPEVLGKSGLLVPPGDVHALAAAMKRMRYHGEALNAMREASAERSSAFDPERRLDALEAVYRELLEARGPAASR
jgi:glycosyltransferase involved in cell wall biosynthesis